MCISANPYLCTEVLLQKCVLAQKNNIHNGTEDHVYSVAKLTGVFSVHGSALQYMLNLACTVNTSYFPLTFGPRRNNA